MSPVDGSVHPPATPVGYQTEEPPRPEFFYVGDTYIHAYMDEVVFHYLSIYIVSED